MKNKITIIGTGYVGLITGACYANAGFDVTCVDKDQNKIEKLRNANIPIYEPNLTQLVLQQMASNRLKFEASLYKPAHNSDFIFITVPTPSSEGGGIDLSSIEEVITELSPLLSNNQIVIIKSTVPVGTCRRMARKIREINSQSAFEMVSNPEFLREGSGINDFINPDRVIIGFDESSAKSLAIIEQLYRTFIVKEIPIFFTSLETAELIKYSSNAFLAVKLSFVNEIASLCEALNVNAEEVLYGVSLDKRIGSSFLQPGPGFGGSCLPKDTQALSQIGRQVGVPLQILNSAIEVNNLHRELLIKKIMVACGGSVVNKKLAILGVSFKANTNDIRESIALTLVPFLHNQGAMISIFDPVVQGKETPFPKQIKWDTDLYKAVEDVDMIIILTEWEIFRTLDLDSLRKKLRNTFMPPTIIDFRNLFNPNKVAIAGLRYISIGRPIVEPKLTFSELTTECN